MITQMKKRLALFLTLAMTLSMLPVRTLAADGDSALVAGWTWTAHPFGNKGETATVANATTQVGGANAQLTYSNVANSTAITFTATGPSIAVNEWASGSEYWQISLSTTGYSGLNISFDAYSSGTGPRDYKVQISQDGSTWYDVDNGAYVLTSSPSNVKTELFLESGATNIDDIATAHIRFQNTSTTSVGNSTVAAGGTSRLYNIKINGTEGLIPAPRKTTKPTATPPGGATAANAKLVPTSQEIEISTVSGATLTGFSWDGEDPDGASAKVANGEKIAVQVNAETYIGELRVIAKEPDKAHSDVVKAFYTTRLATPTATPAAGATNDGTLVTLASTGLPSGGKIYYTIDGTVPTASSTEYTAPFTLSYGPESSVTVKAVAICDGYVDSQVLEAAYTKGVPIVNAMAIAEARKKAKDAQVTVKGVYTGSPYNSAGTSINPAAYIQDDTGGIVLNISAAELAGFGVAEGDEILVKGTISPFNQLIQIKVAPKSESPDAIQIVKKGNGEPPAPIAINTAALNSGKYEGMYITIPMVTFSDKINKTGQQSHQIKKDGIVGTYRANLSSAINADGTYTLWGWGSRNNDSIQLLQKGAVDAGIIGITHDGSAVGDALEVASWSYSSKASTPIPANEGIHKASAQLTLKAGTIGENAKGFSANGWDSGVGTKYWQASFSTLGVANVTVSSAHASSGSGPRDFMLQYSVDNGATFKEVIGGRIVVPNAGLITDCMLKAIPLPLDANNKANVIIRWTVNSTFSSSGGVLASGGTNQINSIVIGGKEFYGPDDVAPVKSSPVSGAVPIKTSVTLSSATMGTTIYYTIDGTDPTQSSVPYSAPIVLSSMPVTIKAYAVKDAKQSPIKAFSFTAAQVGTVSSNKPDGSKISVGLDHITFSTVEKDTVIKYIITSKVGQPGENVSAEQIYNPISPISMNAEDFPAKFEVWATKTNYADSNHVIFNYVLSQGGTPKNYFGQLHSHTAENSDGAGTLEEAFSYAANNSGVDFLAVTDHSNAFDLADKNDGADKYNLTTYNADNVKWNNGLNAANKYTSGKFVGMYGYEMTWSGGPGHINTFNTTGFVSRNNAILNNKSGDKGLQAYYELLSRPDSSQTISQFNHPGTTFGNFVNFGYWDAVIDTRVTLVEVGNGEGAIGSGGYFPSYSQYTLALDKGWHLAPTNNQDNHQKKWGDANTARTVIYTNDFTREGLYQAMRERRVYATEDKNLDIVYTLNDAPLGTILAAVPSSASIKAVINDPDSTDKISKVEIITVGGRVVHSVTPNSQNYTLGYELATPEPGYYYIRVQQADLDIAVTAPVWLGAAKAVGMSELTTDAIMAVTGEKVNLNSSFFNNESEDATLKSLTYAIKDGATITTLTPNVVIASISTLNRIYEYTPSVTGVQTVVLTAVISVGGMEKSYTSEITLDVKNPDDLIYVGVDASHYNEYVAGNYKDSMGNFGKLAGGHSVRVNLLDSSAKLLEALANPKYKMFVFTAPTRRLTPIPGGTYPNYTDEEIAAIANFAKSGGIVVVAGWGDYYESYDYSPKDITSHMAAQQNKLLKAMGSSLRLADDEAKDNDNNPGNNAARLYLTDYNSFKSPLLAGVNPKQVWSQYGGSTIFAVDSSDKPVDILPASVTPVISGYGAINSDGSGKKLDKINSYDDDSDGYGIEMEAGQRPPKYDSDNGKTVLLTAQETVKHGENEALIIVTGGAFMSNFEIKADVENASSLNYSNYNFLENLVEKVNPPVISTIAQAQAGSADETFTIEGIVTSTVWNGTDLNTGFFDCIYVQDETGGINVFPVSSGVEPGQKVRITGIRSAYEGERQLQNAKVKVLTYNPGPVPAPMVVTTKDVKDKTYLGTLVKVTGKVIAINQSAGVVQSIRLQDESGEPCTVYIDGYITKGKTIPGLALNKTFIAIGISSYNENNGQERIRVRDRADVYDPTYVPPTNNDDSVTNVILPGNIQVGTDSVTVKLSSSNDKLNAAANEKVIAANADKPVQLSGGGLTVLIPAGTLTAGGNVNALLVNLKANGNVIKVTKPDGTTAILPISSIGNGNAAYVANIPGTYTIVTNTKTFPDTAGHWAVSAIDFASSHELFTGMGDGTFSPNLPMTRAMLVKTLARMDGGKTAKGSAFSDVPSNAWYGDELAWAAGSGLVEGDGKNFNPDSTLTREQLCLILARYLDYSGLTLAETGPVGAYSDMSSVSPWAKSAMEQAIKTGLIDGKSGGLLDPQGKASRAEIATILQRFVDGVLK